jgi:tetratricopeptide (TPR) repeat protein
MVALVEALATLQTKGIALEIQKIRVLSGVDSVFWSRTQSAYHDLLEQEEEEKPKNFVMPSNAIDYYNQGVQKKEQGQLEEALHFFNKALLVSPHFVEAYNNRGLIKKNQGHYESALDDLIAPSNTNPSLLRLIRTAPMFLKIKGTFNALYSI